MYPNDKIPKQNLRQKQPTTTTTTTTTPKSFTKSKITHHHHQILWNDSLYPLHVVPLGTFQYVMDSTNSKEQHDDKEECFLHFPPIDLEEKQRMIPTLSYHPLPTLVNYDSLGMIMALATRTGDKQGGASSKRVPNQDRIMILHNHHLHSHPSSMSSSLSSSSSSSSYPWKMALLLDGHGPLGHAVAHTAALSLIRKLTSQLLSSHKITNDSLSTIIQNVDQTLPSSLTSGSGSTAIVLIQQQQQQESIQSSSSSSFILMATVGDSQAVVLAIHKRTGNIRIVHQTQPHKPHLPKERERIEQAGGTVLLPTFPEESSRVLIPLEQQQGRMELALAMSRSLGDLEGKVLRILTAEPTVERIEWKHTQQETKEHKQEKKDNDNDNDNDDDAYQYFAILATDGIWDSLSVDEVVRQVGSVAFQNPNRMAYACEQLVLQSSKIWKSRYDNQYRDDISILVISL
jgi:serine/threonine protein phosphatase PrpC